MAEPEVIASDDAFTGRMVRVRVDQLRLPGGDVVTREVASTNDAVAAVPLHDDGTVTLIRQYRHPLGAVCLEIPAGKLDVDGEDPRAAMGRELAEEVRLAGDLGHLVTFANSGGLLDEQTHVYLATGLREADLPEGFTADGEEAGIEVLRLPLDEALAAVLASEPVDAKTLLGLLLVSRRGA